MLASMADRYMQLRQSALSRSMMAIDWAVAFSTLTRAFRLSLQSLMLALGAWLVLQTEITAGAMIAASILLGRALAPLEQLIARWPQVIRAWEAHKNLREFLVNSGGTIKRTQLPKPVGKLEVKGVTLTSTAGRPPILYNVTFTLSPGEALGVVGKSGAGKTTLGRLVMGLVPPNLGEVRLGSALVSHYGAEEIGCHIGYLPQEPGFLPGTVAENIARMSIQPSDRMVVAAAKKAMAHELILTLPDGYDTQLEGEGICLSSGQRQRIALARALYGNPVLLVLDEPNSALDQDGTLALNEAIRSMKSEGCAILIMTHRPVAISECDRLMVIEDGQIKALGPRDSVIKSMMRNASDIQQTITAAGP
jgi:ATP-binding cassette subfamily C protein